MLQDIGKHVALEVLESFRIPEKDVTLISRSRYSASTSEGSASRRFRSDPMVSVLLRTMRRKIRLRSVLGLYCEKSTPVERFTQRKMLAN